MSKRSILLGVKGAPYESEMITSLFRIANAAVTAGHQVVVWTCGGATLLTLRSLGETKPANLLDMGTEMESAWYPSTAELVRRLIAVGEGRVRWYVCRHCMEERGAQDQIPEVKIAPPFRFLKYLEQADTSMIMGVK